MISMQGIEFVIVRSSFDEEVTFAIVKANVTQHRLLNEVPFRDALIQAVTRWIEQTEAGKLFWEYSCQDLNVGDLAAHGIDAGLQPYLEAVGICDLTIQANFNESPCQHWTYDTTLASPVLEAESS